MTEEQLQARLAEIYALAAEGRHRRASRAIFRLFESLVGDDQRAREVAQAFDVGRLTAYEIHTLGVASKPFN